MVAFRALLGPFVAFVAKVEPHPEVWLGSMIAAGFVSDVYDGVLARRWKTDSATLRAVDSIADTIFYLGVLLAIVLRRWQVLRGLIWLLALLLALEAVRMGFDWAKFHRMASYHSYAAKVWGVLLFAASMALLCFDRWFWLLKISLVWGILCDIEGLAISAVLPRWMHDVKHLQRAIELRRQLDSQD
jgi:CDP-diacylglycerol--glycerol-3-phosphate 3-phosphatidyltransferase